MPIKFIVTLDERSGLINCETPASVGTPGEIAMGLRFKKVVADFIQANRPAGAKTTYWKSPNNESRADN